MLGYTGTVLVQSSDPYDTTIVLDAVSSGTTGAFATYSYGGGGEKDEYFAFGDFSTDSLCDYGSSTLCSLATLNPAVANAGAGDLGFQSLLVHLQYPERLNQNPESRYTQLIGTSTYWDIFTVTGTVDELRFDFTVDGGFQGFEDVLSAFFPVEYGAGNFLLGAYSSNGVTVVITEAERERVPDAVTVDTIDNAAFYNDAVNNGNTISSVASFSSDGSDYLDEIVVSFFAGVNPLTMTTDVQFFTETAVVFGSMLFQNTVRFAGVTPLFEGVEVIDAGVSGVIAGDLLTPQPVPSPGTLALLALGLTCLGGLRRYRSCEGR